MSKVRLADVAERVGVSTKSVSNVVNETGSVSEEVRVKILAAIDELGYRPNLAARQLRRGRSGLLALVMPDLREPYFAEFASSFVSAAQRRALTVLIGQTGGERAAELAMVEQDGLPALDGLVMNPLSLREEDLAHRRSGTPLVLVGEQAEALAGPGIHHVGVDNVAAAAAATRHLLNQGRRRIVALGVQRAGPSATSRLRLEGYRQALADAGLTVEDELLAPVEQFHRVEGSAAVQRLLDAGVDFDGLFCFSDTLALGALFTLGVRGVRVPQDVAMIGFDDVEEGRFLSPGFSTVNPNVGTAAETILDILTAPQQRPGGRHRVPFAVVPR